MKSELKSVGEILKKRQKINFMKGRRQMNQNKKGKGRSHAGKKTARGGAIIGGRGKKPVSGRGRKTHGKRK